MGSFKEYEIYFTIKANKRQYYNRMLIVAANVADAKEACKQRVKEQWGVHAFPIQTKPQSTYDPAKEDPNG